MKLKPKKKECTYASHPTWYGKVWHFLAHEDSWLSFLVDAILVILIGKFLILPGLGLALGTDYPLVAVISSSMDHHGQSFDAWWSENGAWYEGHNMSKEKFETFYKYNGFKKGDAFVVKGVAVDKLEVGDVIVYSVEGRSDPIIHRIIQISKDGTFITKGDANSAQFPFELSVTTDQIQGKTIQWIPYFGWLKAGITDIINKFK